MILPPIVFALQAQAQQPPAAPRRQVPDTGIIATGQQVTPAGMQSVFNGRVTAVKFGAQPGEIWVAAPSGVYRLSWRDNRVVATSRFDGAPGIHGIGVDATSGRVLVTTVGRRPEDMAGIIPGSNQRRAPSVAQLFGYDANGVAKRASGPDSAAVMFNSGSIGSYMIGNPAATKTAGPSGKRLVVVPLPANDRLSIHDAESGKQLSTIATGVLPVHAVVSDDGTEAWVSVYGGSKPKPGELAVSQCCRELSEPVRVDAKGLARAGSVIRVDLVTGKITDSITVGLHPGAMAWDQKRYRLYVPNGNSDSITIVNSWDRKVAGAIAIAPFKERNVGLAPTSVALSPDGNTLYVTLGGANAVAVYDVSATPRLKGLIPTGWYPASIDVSTDGRTIAVATLLGAGSTQSRVHALTAGNALAVRGSVNVIPAPSDAELAAYSVSVAQNSRLHLASGAAGPAPLAPRTNVAARAVPERPGEPSLIDHVVYIIRENRTYDQVLGDLGRGNGDPSLTMYGRDVTPNAHALSEQFVTLDHFFATGGNSADGHHWLTQANETDYPMWPLYFGRSYPSEGDDPLAYSAGGFLWETAAAKNRIVSVFGEFAPAPSDSIPAVRKKFLDEYQDRAAHDGAYFRERFRKMYDTHSPVPSLDKVLVREYPGWTQESPDVVKADVILEHLKEWEKAGAMPHLTMIILPSDHTVGTSADWTTPKANVADNDMALGKVVDGLSHSQFWKSMAILVVEDDAQDGVDHIDGHRTVALAISPYSRRGSVDSTFYSQQGMVKTIELMLGLPALSIFDLVANDMHASFIGPNEKPDLAAYSALTPKQTIYEFNPKPNTIRGQDAAARRAAAIASGKMDFSAPDEAPSEKLNEILWHDARGWNVKYPGVKKSLFFPLSVDLTDDEREKKKARDKDDDDKPVKKKN